MNQTLVLTFLFALTISPSAHACRDPLSETHTFFEKLPDAVMSKPVIAQVEILSSQVDEKHRRVSKAKVLKGIKGTKEGSVLTIHSETHSCDRDPEVSKGQKYFVAGAVEGEVFRGVWKQRELMKGNGN